MDSDYDRTSKPLPGEFFQQYRLFFRYHAPSKVIVFAWVNDEDTRRAYESSDDAYRVFHKGKTAIPRTIGISCWPRVNACSGSPQALRRKAWLLLAFWLAE